MATINLVPNRCVRQQSWQTYPSFRIRDAVGRSLGPRAEAGPCSSSLSSATSARCPRRLVSSGLSFAMPARVCECMRGSSRRVSSVLPGGSMTQHSVASERLPDMGELFVAMSASGLAAVFGFWRHLSQSPPGRGKRADGGESAFARLGAYQVGSAWAERPVALEPHSHRNEDVAPARLWRLLARSPPTASRPRLRRPGRLCSGALAGHIVVDP